MNTSLAKPFHLEKESDFLNLDIPHLVKSASTVIAPLGPINKFAARSPWAGLEGNTFEHVARRIKVINDVDIYPSESILQSARNRGEINSGFLEIGLQNWLDLQSLELPREVAEQYCRTALLEGETSVNRLAIPGLKNLAKKLSGFKYQINEKSFVQTYSQRLEQQGNEKMTKDVNRHTIKWCKLFLDESQAILTMPNREKGFYQAWRTLAPNDPDLHPTVRKKLNELPKESSLALKEALFSLDIPYSEIEDYLKAHLLALPGWAGMMLWRLQQSKEENTFVMDYLAVRMVMEWVMMEPYLPLPKQKIEGNLLLEPLIASWVHWGNLSVQTWSQLSYKEVKAHLQLAYRFDEILRHKLWLEAWEKTYEDQLMKRITTRQTTVAQPAKPALAQFAFCIDVRSEPFRRHLEQAGPFETFGTAGFFGLPIETCELGNQHSHHSLPVMFQPQFKVKEAASIVEAKKYQQRQHVAHSLGTTFKTMKHNMLSSLLLPEISGPLLSFQTLARSFAPRGIGYAFRKIYESWLRKPSTELSLGQEHSSEKDLPIGFSEEEQVYYVRKALKMMGLTEHFAPLVVICGHGSHSTNNPYASALDCGACGGASSAFNARVLAALCNLPRVRSVLASEGISIPKDTVFVAAEHITSLDELRFLTVPKLSDAARKALDFVQTILQKVSKEANGERLLHLPRLGAFSNNPKAEARRLAEDWSEVRPEWGLARNAAFIIGDRKLTQACNLDGRTFLHNYDWRKDQNGAILSNIITGPATVAQWISLQYYASTVAPHFYGSGNKATQTITAGIGVMQGNASDLLAGLPWQSVMKSDQEFYHVPLRLLVVIQAPREFIKRLLDHDSVFHQKVKNGWIRLSSIDPDGCWESWS